MFDFNRWLICKLLVSNWEAWDVWNIIHVISLRNTKDTIFTILPLPKDTFQVLLILTP